MSNADIFGHHESITGQVAGDKVSIVNVQRRTAWDAGVPPGQSVTFDFYVAEFPIKLTVIRQGDNIGTISRTVRRRSIDDIAAVRTDSREVASALGGRTSSTAPAPIALSSSARFREPWQPDDIGNLGDLDAQLPPLPPPPPDYVIPFEITYIPPNGLAPLVFTRPKDSEIREWPGNAAFIDPAYFDRGKGKWTISVKNITDTGARMDIQLISVQAIAPVRHQTSRCHC